MILVFTLQWGAGHILVKSTFLCSEIIYNYKNLDQNGHSHDHNTKAAKMIAIILDTRSVKEFTIRKVRVQWIY